MTILENKNLIVNTNELNTTFVHSDISEFCIVWNGSAGFQVLDNTKYEFDYFTCYGSKQLDKPTVQEATNAAANHFNDYLKTTEQYYN